MNQSSQDPADAEVFVTLGLPLICGWIVSITAAWALTDTKVFDYHTAYWVLAGGTALTFVLIFFGLSYLVRSTAPPRYATARSAFQHLSSEAAYWLVRVLFLVIVFPLVTLPSNVMLFLNQLLDGSNAVETAYPVHRKSTTTGRRAGEHYAFFVTTPGVPPTSHSEQSVRIFDTPTYARITPQKSSIVMKMHPGAFGFPWTVDSPGWPRTRPNETTK